METSPSSGAKDEGLRLLKEGKLDEAIAELTKAAQADPDDAQVQTFLGVAYTQKGDKLHAIAALEESVRLKETPKSCYNLGQIYEQVHRIDQAIWQYRKALDLDPDYTIARQTLDRLQAGFAAAHPQPQAPPPAAEPTQAMGAMLSGPPPIGAIPAGPPLIGTAPGPQPTQTMPAYTGHGGYPQPSGPPDFAAEMAKKEFAVKEQHQANIKSGIIYGVLCGAGFFLLVNIVFALWLAPFAAMVGAGGGLIMAIIKGTIQGGIFGGIVGFWVGHTYGGATAGAMAGAVVNGAVALVLGLIGLVVGAHAMPGESSFLIGLVFGAVLMNAIVGAVLGAIVGALVDMSIGQV